MSRSKWKGIYISKFLIKKATIPKKIWSRNATIPLKLLNKHVLIHNGKNFNRVFITIDKIGYKFGEFSYTRKDKKRIKKGKH